MSSPSPERETRTVTALTPAGVNRAGVPVNLGRLWISLDGCWTVDGSQTYYCGREIVKTGDDDGSDNGVGLDMSKLPVPDEVDRRVGNNVVRWQTLHSKALAQEEEEEDGGNCDSDSDDQSNRDDHIKRNDRCGPICGPQCSDCKHFQATRIVPPNSSVTRPPGLNANANTPTTQSPKSDHSNGSQAAKYQLSKSNWQSNARNMAKQWYSAAWGGDTTALTRLAVAGADVNQVLTFGKSRYTALYWLARENKEDAVRTLLRLSARVELGFPAANETPLMMATKSGAAGVAAALLASDADTDIRDNDGYTALWRAAYYGYAEIARMLLEASAEANMRCPRKGKFSTTPLKIAQRRGFMAVAETIENFSINLLFKLKLSYLEISAYDRVKWLFRSPRARFKKPQVQSSRGKIGLVEVEHHKAPEPHEVEFQELSHRTVCSAGYW